MVDSGSSQAIVTPDAILAPGTESAAPTAAGQAALDAAQALAQHAASPATLRAYRADWAHFAAWCAEKGFVPVPAAPAIVGAYLGSLADSHAPSSIRRRPARKAAALSLVQLRQLLATCDSSARGRRDRALLLFGFTGALRRSELVSLHVEDVAIIAGGLRLRILRGKTDQTGQGAEIGLPRGRHAETCPVRAFEAWQAVAKRNAGPLFRKISTGGGDTKLHPDLQAAN